MPFVGFFKSGQLSEKPWKADAVLRLIASVAVCMFIAGVIASLISSFNSPSKTHPGVFLAKGGSLVLFIGAVIILGRPWPLENYIRKLIQFLLCVYGSFSLMWLVTWFQSDEIESINPTLRTLIAILGFQGAALVLVHRFVREHNLGWAEAFGFRNGPKQAFLLGIYAGLLMLPIAWGMQWILSFLLERLTLHPHEQEAVQLLRATGAWTDRVVLGIATIALAPVAEEILFRGILYPAIKRAGHPHLALWFTAVLFGAIHLNLLTFLPLTLLALVLVWLYERTDNLLACIVTHALFNAANFVALYLTQK
jgi:membrane protease YdiL (CAAX protease family)